MQTVSAIIYIALLGLAAHLVGEALPRRWFRFDRGLYRCRAWERGGAVYERFSIHRWKLLLPDKSRHARGMVKKQLGGMNGDISGFSLTLAELAGIAALLLFGRM